MRVRGFLVSVLTRSSLVSFDLSRPDNPVAVNTLVPLKNATALSCIGSSLYAARVGTDGSGRIDTLTGS